MLGRQAIELAAHRLRQRLVGSAAAGPQGIAADTRYALGGQKSCERWRRAEGDVGVPVVVIRQERLMRIDQHDLGQFRQHRVDGMYVQGAEARREAALRFRSDRLVTEQQYLVFHQQLAEPLDDGLRQLLRGVDPMHYGAERARQPSNFNSHVTSQSIRTCGPATGTGAVANDAERSRTGTLPVR